MKKFLLGLVGGATLGMLFAPEKGKDFRKKLSKSEEKLKDFGKEFLLAGKDVSAEVKEFLEKNEVKEFFEKGKENISELLENGKELSEKGKEEVKLLVKKAKGTLEGSFGKVGKKDDILGEIKNFFTNEKK